MHAGHRQVPGNEWIEGPYAGPGALAHGDGQQVQRAVHSFVVDFRGTPAQREGEFNIRRIALPLQEMAERQYPLAPALIHHAAEAAKTRAAGRKITPEDIYAGIREVLDDRLGDFAKRVEVTQSWDELVLPQDQLDAITYLIARIRQRRTVYEQWGFAANSPLCIGCPVRTL